MKSMLVAFALVLPSLIFALSSSLDEKLLNPDHTFSSTDVRRKRVLASENHSDSTVTKYVLSAFDSVAETLEELWARESALSQKELERHLFWKIGSLPPIPAPITPPIQVPSAAPTDDGCLNGRTPGQFLLDTLIEVTSAENLLDPATPQGRAFSFILNDTLVGTNVCVYGTIEQRYGLATFFYSTNGPSWIDDTDWLSSKPECQWYGIVCNDENRAVNLTMESNNVAGILPNELSTLYLLDRIGLFSNNVSGTIPEGIQNLTAIQVIDLENNQLSGPAFPTALLALSDLRQLFLSSNFLNGTIPEVIADRYPLMTDLWVADNNLTGPLPTTIGAMTNLETFIMYENKLDGELPPTIDNVTDLTNLQLFDNMFDSAIPSQLYALTKLTVLRIDQNFLTGTLSSDIGQLNLLTDLRISNNFIEGTLPETIQEISDLRYLAASNSLLKGTIPNIFDNFANLIDLDLSTAFFSGLIPDTLFNSTSLTNVYLSNNALTGTIPSNFASPPTLVDLYLDNNLLNGTVPSIASSDFRFLSELLLQNNELTGEIPDSICNLRSSSALENLFTDCGGASPEIQCTFPTCCNRCFAGGEITDQRKHRRVLFQEEQEHPNQRTVMLHGE